MFEAYAPQPEAPDTNKWLRVIALLLAAIFICGGAYLYFNQQPERHLHEVRCTVNGCTDTDLGRIQ